MKHESTKTFEHVASAAFRQWRATHSHCSLVHGYALTFKFTFGAPYLDERNWVMDFGGMKELKQQIENKFDHCLVVAADDPKLAFFREMAQQGVCKLTVLDDGVGCEKFAEHAFYLAQDLLKIKGMDGRVRVLSCEVMEHGANSAIFKA